MARKGQRDEAIKEYQEAISIDPSLIHAYDNLGRELARIGQWKAAISAYEKALHLDSKWSDAYYGLGCALAKMGNNGEAIDNLRAFLRIRPDDNGS